MLHIPNIFFINLAAVIAILSTSTIIGRACCNLFPYRFKPIIKYYSSPILGLSILTIFSSIYGKILPYGNSIILPICFAIIFLWSLQYEIEVKIAIKHAFTMSLFGIICGVSIFGALFFYGAINGHNDAFTYFVHSSWLQDHAFCETISTVNVNAATTQVYLYQQKGFRMGASFLLALFQSLLHIKWSYEIYPALVISSIGACCSSIGPCISKTLLKTNRLMRFLILSLPAFSFGGIVFGANFGFLPQTVALCLGSGGIFMVGFLFSNICDKESNFSSVIKAAIPCSICLAATVYAYSEISPLIFIGILGGSFLFAVRNHSWSKTLTFVCALLGLSLLLLNTELIRIYSALQTQMGVVVGSPVNWSMLGYVAHILGVHGGAWDLFQWANPVGYLSAFFNNPAIFTCGILLFAIGITILILNMRISWAYIIDGTLMPTIVILLVIGMGILYFRYFVHSPFSVGIGQSWSQFKLAEWAHPFAMAFILLSISNLNNRLKTKFKPILITVFVLGISITVLNSVARTKALIQYYGGTHDLNQFYLDFRKAVIENCPVDRPIYLALNGRHHKFRQMAAYYLPDREVLSDWTGDDYIYHQLPKERRVQKFKAGQCIVEPISQLGIIKSGKQIGPFRIGILKNENRILITSSTGKYEIETDGNNWWQWIDKKTSFSLKPLLNPKSTGRTRMVFEYIPRNKQMISLYIISKDNKKTKIYINNSKENALTAFNKIINIPPNELKELIIETDGKATILGELDDRKAALLIRNIRFEPLLEN